MYWKCQIVHTSQRRFPGNGLMKESRSPSTPSKEHFWRKPPYCMQKHTGRWKKMIPERYSLHYADIATLAQAESAHSAPKFCPVITPKCGICFSLNCHLGMKISMALRFLKCGLTHFQVSSEIVSFFTHFPSSTGVINSDSDCSILCLSVSAS